MTNWICINFHKLIAKNLKILKKKYLNQFYLSDKDYLKFILQFLKDIATYLKLHSLQSKKINKQDEEMHKKLNLNNINITEYITKEIVE